MLVVCDSSDLVTTLRYVTFTEQPIETKAYYSVRLTRSVGIRIGLNKMVSFYARIRM